MSCCASSSRAAARSSSSAVSSTSYEHVGKRLDTVLGNPAAQPTETRVLSRFAEDVFPDAVVLLDVDRVKPSLGDPGYLCDGVVDPDHAHRPAGAL